LSECVNNAKFIRRRYRDLTDFRVVFFRGLKPHGLTSNIALRWLAPTDFGGYAVTVLARAAAGNATGSLYARLPRI